MDPSDPSLVSVCVGDQSARSGTCVDEADFSPFKECHKSPLSGEAVFSCGSELTAEGDVR